MRQKYAAEQNGGDLGYFVHDEMVTPFADAAFALALGSAAFAQEAQKPNILVIFGDDIGTWNISHNNRGMMGYKTPNIDRIAREGMLFTDCYGEQSCTAGRASSRRSSRFARPTPISARRGRPFFRTSA